ncbi:hypothetical protein AAIB33_06490 [Microbacterium sp. AZCO]|uniref:hypothetical protein n=1 Tax=Microbacterium sp. AZCO TaxID=3142976 RepID=UPI0031F456E4
MRLRWLLPTVFIVVAVVAGWLTYAYRSDPTWLQVWIGVALSFLTAGLVDAVALRDTARREAESRKRMAPVHAMIDHRLIAQQRLFIQLAGVVLAEDVRGDLLTKAGDIRTLPELKLSTADLDETLYPPLTRRQRMQELSRELRDTQYDLENMAAVGYRTSDIQAVSDIVLRSSLMNLIEAYWATASDYSRNGCKEKIADAFDVLRGLHLQSDPRQT